MNWISEMMFCVELEKIADAATRKLRSMLASGNREGAESFADTLMRRGGAKTTQAGKQVSFLGSGAEGPAHVVLGAKDAPTGLAVRKAYDRDAPYVSKTLLANKMEASRRLKDDARFAKVYSPKLRKGAGGTPYTVNEWVKGSTGRTVDNETMHGLRSAALPKGQSTPGGLTLGDIHSDNIITDQHGTSKVVDYTPARVRTQREAAAQSEAILGKLRAKQAAYVNGDTDTPVSHSYSSYLERRAKAARVNSSGAAMQASDLTDPRVGIPRAQVRRTMMGFGTWKGGSSG